MRQPSTSTRTSGTARGSIGAADNVVETDFEIRVPRRTNLDLTLFSASLDVRGVDGSHRVQTFSSGAKLDDVNGSIRAKSFSGAIEIRATAWADNQTIDVETFSGGVDLRIPESARGRVQFESFSGSLHSALPLTVERQPAKTAQRSARLSRRGRSRAHLRQDLQRQRVAGPIASHPSDRRWHSAGKCTVERFSAVRSQSARPPSHFRVWRDGRYLTQLSCEMPSS